MGVPKFFRYIRNQYRDAVQGGGGRAPGETGAAGSIINKILPSVTTLSIDMNSLFHDAYSIALYLNHLYERTADPTRVSHLDIIKQQLFSLINLYRPKKGLILAVDGVPTVAKMQEQKRRRVASSGEDTEVTLPSPNNPLVAPFNKSLLLTPGTYYMDQLEEGIKIWIQNVLLPQGKPLPITPQNIVFMGHREPGEGEHKILNSFRNNEILEDPSIGVHLIYGADADLIFLAMVLREQLDMSVVIGREQIRRDRDTNQIVTNTRQILQTNIIQVDAISERLTAEYGISSLDFIFLTMLMGNDFVPGIIEARNFDKFLEQLLQVYAASIQPTESIVRWSRRNRNWDLDWKLLLTFLEQLVAREATLLDNLSPERQADNYIEVSRKNPLLHYTNDPENFRALYYGRAARAPWQRVSEEMQSLLNAMGVPNFFKPGPEHATHYAHHFFCIWYWSMGMYFGMTLSNTYSYPYWFPPMLPELLYYLQQSQKARVDEEGTPLADFIGVKVEGTLKEAGFLDIYPVHEIFAVLPQAGKHLIPKELMQQPKIQELWNYNQIEGFHTTDFLATAEYLTRTLLNPIPIKQIVATVNSIFILKDPDQLQRFLGMNINIARKAEREGRTVYQSDQNYRLLERTAKEKYLTHARRTIIRLRPRHLIQATGDTLTFARNTRLDPRLRKSLRSQKEINKVLSAANRPRIAAIKLQDTTPRILKIKKGTEKKGLATSVGLPLAPSVLKQPWSERYQHLPTLQILS